MLAPARTRGGDLVGAHGRGGHPAIGIEMGLVPQQPIPVPIPPCEPVLKGTDAGVKGLVLGLGRDDGLGLDEGRKWLDHKWIFVIRRIIIAPART